MRPPKRKRAGTLNMFVFLLGLVSAASLFRSQPNLVSVINMKPDIHVPFPPQKLIALFPESSIVY